MSISYKTFRPSVLSRHLVYVLAVGMVGCASQDKLKSEKSPLLIPSVNGEQVNYAPESGTDPEIRKLNKAQFLPPMESANKFKAAEELKAQQYKFAETGPIQMTVENMPIRDFVHYVMGDLLKANYVLDESIIDQDKTVSIKIEEPLPANELFEIVADLLEQKKLYIHLKDKVFYIFKNKKSSKDANIGLGFGAKVEDVPVGLEEVIQLVPLKYTSFNRISRILNWLTTAKVYPSDDNASLNIRGTRSQVVKVLSLLQLLDQPSAKSQYIGVYPLIFLPPNDFVSTIQQLLKQDGFDTNTGVSFTPIEHLNSVIVHASEPHLLDRIEMWQRQIDKASETASQQYFIFYPKRANALALGKSLNSILALQTGNNARASTKEKDAQANLENIVVDEQRNALVFYMQPKQYQAIYPLLNQLDVIPKQVVVEATIMEVTLTDRLTRGVEWFISNKIDSFGTQGGLGELGGGLTFTLNKPNLDIVMNALASTNQVNIVSNPKIMVTNGETANLNVGTEFPVISSTVSNPTEGSGQVVQTVSYRSTGITLDITPKVNAQNYVELEINQSLSETGENELSGIDSPIELKRDFKTKVLVEEGKTLILAGLVSENKSNSDSRVPLLGDIPILGEAFKNKNDRTQRTELVLMITPRVVSDSEDLLQIKQAIGSRLNNIDLTSSF